MVVEAPVASERDELESDPDLWVYTLFPSYTSAPDGSPVRLASYHEEFWRFVWLIRRGEVPTIGGRQCECFVCIWSRSAAKSTSVEMAVAALALMRRRRYGLYISSTQVRADDHVGNVGNMLRQRTVREWYPAEAARRLTGYEGRAKTMGAWRRNRIQTDHFTLDALGLDSAVRGAKIDEDRPDLIILDDIDSELDTSETVQKNIRVLTTAILPAGSGDAITIGVQNLIHRGGLFAKLSSGEADFLANRIVSGPHPALDRFSAERDAVRRINRPGWDLAATVRPTWRDRDYWQGVLDRIGMDSFLRECQHETSDVSDLVYPQFHPQTHRWPYAKLPKFAKYVGALDFSSSEGLTAHPAAGLVAGLTAENVLVVIAEFKARGANIAQRQAMWALEMEQNFGRIEWRADRSQGTAVQLLRQFGSLDVKPSLAGKGGRTGGDSENANRASRTRLVGRRLMPTVVGDHIAPEARRPGLYYLRGLVEFEAEALMYHNKRGATPESETPATPVKVYDDLMDCLAYLVEGVDGRAEFTGKQGYAEAVWA